MITKEMIERINELANKKKTSGLTDEECDEQMSLRVAYIEAFRKNLKEQLDDIEIID